MHGEINTRQETLLLELLKLSHKMWHETEHNNGFPIHNRGLELFRCLPHLESNVFEPSCFNQCSLLRMLLQIAQELLGGLALSMLEPALRQCKGSGSDLDSTLDWATV